jgi:hypothetical protein
VFDAVAPELAAEAVELRMIEAERTVYLGDMYDVEGDIDGPKNADEDDLQGRWH